MNTWQENLYNGISKVEIVPADTNHIETVFIQKFVLYVDGVYLGEFPTYTQALEHTIELVNDLE